MKRRKAVKKDRHFVELGERIQKQKNMLAHLMSLWVTTLGLEHWDTEALYHLEEPDNWSRRQVGECICSWKYKTITIGFAMNKISHSSEQRLEEIVVHELCHVLVNGMRTHDHDDRMMEQEERVVTELAYAFIRARHWKTGKGGR